MAKKQDPAKQLDSVQKEIKNLKSQLSKSTEAMADSMDDVVDKAGELLKITQRHKELQDGINELYKDQIAYTDHARELEEKISKLDKVKDAALIKRYKIEQDEAQLIADSAKNQIKSAVNAKKLLKMREKELNLSEEQIKARKKLAAFEEKYKESISGALGFVDDITDTIEDIPVVGGILSKALGLDTLKEELTKDLTKQLFNFADTATSAFTQAGGGIAGMASAARASIPIIAQMGATLWASLAPILPIVLAIGAALFVLKKALDVEKEAVELAKNLDISKKEAFELHHEAIAIAEEMHTVGVTSEEVAKTMSELRKETGYNVGEMAKHNKYAKDLLETTTLLVEKQGLTTEEAYGMSQAAIATGIPMQNIALMASTMGDELVSGKEIMQDLGKVSKTVLINFSKNPQALVKAVKQAKLLGTTLDKINAAGDAMLDIESSLENEMKASVLLGRSVNLNAAREAALRGDTATVMQEISRQAGSAAEYQEMMPIQQKALAEAMGMTREELDDMMMKQKELEKLGYSQAELDEKMKLTGADRAAELERIAKLRGKEAADSLAAQYAEEDRVAAMDKLKDVGNKLMDVFVGLAGPILEMIDPIVDIVTWAMPGLIVITKAALSPIKMLLDSITYMKEQFASVKDIVHAMLQIFSGGSILGGIEAIGKAVKDLLLAPFKFIGKTVSWIFGGGDKSSEASPESGGDTAHDFISRPGMGIQKFSKGDLVMAVDEAALGGGDPSSTTGQAGPTISELIQQQNALETRTAVSAEAIATGNTAIAELLKQQNTLLQTLITKVDQPVKVSIGGLVIDTIETMTSLRRGYVAKADSGYGALG